MGKNLRRLGSFAIDFGILVRASAGVMVPIYVGGFVIVGSAIASMMLLELYAPLALLPWVALGVVWWGWVRWDQWRYRRPRDVD